MIPKLKVGDKIQVKWTDASSHDISWITESELPDMPGGMEILSIGIYLGKQDGCLRMCGDRHNHPDFISRVARMFDIPLGCISKVTKMR